MEENVALNKKHQSKFAKKVKKAKERLTAANSLPQAPIDQKQVKVDDNQRGVVYLGHIPHGFYETEMRSYFRQFGKVTNVRLCRSKSTGRSKGFAFIEFRYAAVAKVAAETMNNYVMFNRRLIAKAVPYNNHYKSLSKCKSWSLSSYPKKELREKGNRRKNSNVNDAAHLKMCRRLMSNVSRTLNKLQTMGISYSFMPDDPDDILLKLKNTNNTKSDSK